ncbi:MAG: ComF family protein [Acidimicrobiales bacterium]|nr:ComF family protein [Acidimicrobiales bacterium]
MKYRNARRVIPAVAARLADAVADAVEPIGLVDAVVAVPASLAKRRQRGYDQGVLLARGVARRLGAPMHHALVRLDRHGQTGRGRTERLDGAHIATRRGTRVSGTVVVVDDVCTTGSSLSHAAEVLRAAGAWHVVGAVLTRRDREPDLLGGHWARSCRGPLA